MRRITRRYSEMLFSSIMFIFYFLPITLGVYYLIPKSHLMARNAWLLVASLVFYSWGEPVYLFLMIFSAAFNYYMAGEIDREKTEGGSGKKNLVFALVINLMILGFFKYFGFLMDTINAVTGLSIGYTALPLPVGISFYTFQALSYIFDVYRDKVKVQKNPMMVALYLALFPQLIAGPIVNYKDIEEQLTERSFSFDSFGSGAIRFCIGMGKKVILANNLGALNAYVAAIAPDELTVLTAWIGIICYTLQIYFDFSGYSDMAIGLGRMFGFRFKENFNYPYTAVSITDFWRRWHISLSSWFRDYVYIPLGGNRVPVRRHIMNLLIVWSLTGLWHGASWNFVLWGVYFGVILIIEKYLIGGYIEKLPSWAQHLYTMLIVTISWVFFSITDIGEAVRYLGIMFGIGSSGFMDSSTLYLLRTGLVLIVMGVLGSTKRPVKEHERISKGFRWHETAWALLVLLISVSYLVYGSYNPFLYFRF